MINLIFIIINVVVVIFNVCIDEIPRVVLAVTTLCNGVAIGTCISSEIIKQVQGR